MVGSASEWLFEFEFQQRAGGDLETSSAAEQCDGATDHRSFARPIFAVYGGSDQCTRSALKHCAG